MKLFIWQHRIRQQLSRPLLALLAATLLVSACDKKPSAEEQLQEAKTALDHANFGRACELTESLVAAQPHDSGILYLRAQALAKFGDIDGALRALQEAVDAGFHDFKGMDATPNLLPLRGTPQYQLLLQQHAAATVPQAIVSDKEIRAGDASIKEVDGQQVIQAGDIHLTLPKDD
jgi:DNA-binding SARP family transcriptional activator